MLTSYCQLEQQKHFSEIEIEIQQFSFKKVDFNMSAKWPPICVGFDVFTSCAHTPQNTSTSKKNSNKWTLKHCGICILFTKYLDSIRASFDQMTFIAKVLYHFSVRYWVHNLPLKYGESVVSNTPFCCSSQARRPHDTPFARISHYNRYNAQCRPSIIFGCQRKW